MTAAAVLPWIIFTAGPALLACYGRMLYRIIRQPEGK